MIKPLGDRVVLKVKEIDNKTRSGIIVPSNEVSNQATVVAVGPGRVFENGQGSPLEVAEGDQVIFTKFVGTQIEYNGESYLIVHEGDIIAVL
ncbi:co-chaperone GroES [Bacillus atrophaeus]|uniref:co-chaperone GroES n=1 Tax=Bacillus atrophaeus TaxID=1452 RepID=UPI002E2416BD|nr:co-chaperone GroES [Bacillus atrophaeus]